MSDEADRLERLENAVQELRNDFDSMAPAIVRLVSIEGDIQALIKQLEVLNGDAGAVSAEQIPVMEESALNQTTIPAQSLDAPVPPLNITADEETQTGALDPPPVQEPIPAPYMPPLAPAPVVVATPPPAAPPVTPRNSGTSVLAVRVGEHPGKIRIVLDVSGKSPAFTADLDNNEKILVVELPETGWTAEAQKAFTGNPLLSLYRIEKLGENGTMMILQLKGTSSIGYKAASNNPDGTSKVVIDLNTAK